MPVRDHFRAYGRQTVEATAALVARATARQYAIRLRDLGLGGACVELSTGDGAPQPLVVDDAVTLELTAPTLWDPLRLAGRVRWIRKARSGRTVRAGLRFDHADAAPLYALFRLLGARSE